LSNFDIFSSIKYTTVWFHRIVPTTSVPNNPIQMEIKSSALQLDQLHLQSEVHDETKQSHIICSMKFIMCLKFRTNQVDYS